jgi:hypothetical protein
MAPAIRAAARLPAALAGYLIGDLGLATPSDPAAEVAVWLKARGTSLTELVGGRCLTPGCRPQGTGRAPKQGTRPDGSRRAAAMLKCHGHRCNRRIADDRSGTV